MSHLDDYFEFVCFFHAIAYLNSIFSGLDDVSTGSQLAVFFSFLYSCLQ